MRGYETSTYTFEPGRLSVTSGRPSRRDVTMSLDPVAFLQIGYKRTGLARPILTGRAVAWGRRPWVALQFPGYFQDP